MKLIHAEPDCPSAYPDIAPRRSWIIGREVDGNAESTSAGALSSSHKFVRITGAPGAGKTWMCHQLAAEYLRVHGANGRVVYVETFHDTISPLRTALDFDQRFASTKLSAAPSAAAKLRKSVLRANKQPAILLVLDGTDTEDAATAMNAARRVLTSWPATDLMWTAHRHTAHVELDGLPLPNHQVVDLLLDLDPAVTSYTLGHEGMASTRHASPIWPSRSADRPAGVVRDATTKPYW